MNHNEAIEFYWTSIKARATLHHLTTKTTNTKNRARLLDEARNADCDVAFARKEMVK